MDEIKDKNWYLSRISIGNIIAFKLNDNIFSGKVIEVNDNDLVIKTKNSSVYYIKKGDVVWVKNGTKWPVGIYNALKHSIKNKEN